MPNRKGKWLLVPVDNGLFDVMRNGRQVASGLTWAQAMRCLLRKAEASDRLQREEDDGYRVRLSPSELRRGKE